MFNHRHFREAVIRPALDDLGLNSPNAEEILVATMAQETLGGCYVRQVKGPALGIFEVEPNSYHSLWDNFISKDSEMVARILKSNGWLARPPAEYMIWNLKYATQIARLFYRAVKEALPDKNDVEGLWKYYKKYFNSIKGAATREQFMRNYDMFMGADWDQSDLPLSHIIVTSDPGLAAKARAVIIKKDSHV